MEYDEVKMFADAIPQLRASEQITAYNTLRLANADPKKIRSEMRKLERAANGGRMDTTKRTLEERVAIMRAAGVEVIEQ